MSLPQQREQNGFKKWPDYIQRIFFLKNPTNKIFSSVDSYSFHPNTKNNKGP